MKYMLWSDESRESIKNSEEMKLADKILKGISSSMLGILDEANQRHNEEMLTKDIEIAKLETELKLYKELQGR